MREAKLIRKAAVLADHKQGITVKALAKKYHISETAVRNYLKEDRAKDTPEAAAQEAQRKKKKQERNEERRCTIEERTARSQERQKKVKAYIEAGMSPREAAEKEGLSYGTVTDYIRGEKIPTSVLTYKDTLCAAVGKCEIRKWAKNQLMSQLRTPEGKMTVCEVYPNILRLVNRQGHCHSFTIGELYYINQNH